MQSSNVLGHERPCRRSIALIAAVALVHAIATIALGVISFGQGMARFESGASPTSAEKVVEALAAVLSFPVLAALKLNHGQVWFPDLWGYIPVLVNSLLWALALVQGARVWRKRAVRALVD